MGVYCIVFALGVMARFPGFLWIPERKIVENTTQRGSGMLRIIFQMFPVDIIGMFDCRKQDAQSHFHYCKAIGVLQNTTTNRIGCCQQTAEVSWKMFVQRSFAKVDGRV
jgi:hypothetical protein